jgi:hypothetical protein
MRTVGRATLVIWLLLMAMAVVALASSQWSNLQRVSVTVQNGSLPPPYGKAHTKQFTTSAALARVTKALNANHIGLRSHVLKNTGCAGGYNVTLIVVPRGHKELDLTAYRCGGKTFGYISGNVPNFLSAVGISAP